MGGKRSGKISMNPPLGVEVISELQQFQESVILRSCRATVRLRWIFSGLDHWIALKIGEVVC